MTGATSVSICQVLDEHSLRGRKRRPDDQVCVLIEIIHCFTWLSEIKHISSVAVLTIKKLQLLYNQSGSPDCWW